MKWLAAWYWRQVAAWAQMFRRTDAAIDCWERVLALQPEQPHALASIAHLSALRGDRARAIALLQRSAALAPQAATWFNLAYLLQETERHEEALAAFDRAIALDAKLDRAWYGKALSLIKLGRVADAIPLLKRNVELQPMSPYGWYQLAHAYQRLGQREQVAKTIRRLAAFEPKVARQLEDETGVSVGVEAKL